MGLLYAFSEEQHETFFPPSLNTETALFFFLVSQGARLVEDGKAIRLALLGSRRSNSLYLFSRGFTFGINEPSESS